GALPISARQWAAVSTARVAMTVHEQNPSGCPSLSRRFTRTTDALAGEQPMPRTIVVEMAVVLPITLHGATPEFELEGVVGVELDPPQADKQLTTAITAGLILPVLCVLRGGDFMNLSTADGRTVGKHASQLRRQRMSF